MKYLLIALIFSSILSAQPTHSASMNGPEIVVNNRILTTVNGKTISVLDVMKQMDVFLSEHYPQYLDSKPARLQFYSMQWKSTLQRMIDQELMMADAESREVKATDAEIREEIQNRYGPNVMGSLDRLGLTYEEAKKMVHQDLVVQKIQWLRVSSKALAKVTTEIIREAYKDHLQKNPPKEMWTYQFLTLRYDTLETALSLAKQIAQLHDASEGVLIVAVDLFKQTLPETPENSGSHLTLSSELQSEDKELSQSHREVLRKLSPNTWSPPVIQESRDGSQVVRIFHLKAHTKQDTPAFETLATGLKQELLNKYADAEMEAYIARLHERFGYDQNSFSIPSQFEPFSF